MQNWEAFLADYEAKIDLTEASLDSGDPLDPVVLVAFEPPDGLGPLPESLREKALNVMRKNEALERRLSTALGAIGRELGNATQAAAGARRFSAFTETVVPKYFDGGA